MNEFPPCNPAIPANGCCSVGIPNTSSWQVICAQPSYSPTAQTIPVLSGWGSLALGVAIVAVACWKLRA